VVGVGHEPGTSSGFAAGSLAGAGARSVAYAGPVKEFWVYTALRLALFAGSAAIVFGIWFAIADEVPLVWVVVLAFVASGIGSYFLLRPQREAFAAKVETRAQRVSQKFEESRAKEDSD